MNVSESMVNAAADVLSKQGCSDKKAIELAIAAALSARKPVKANPIKSWTALQEVAERGYRDALECLAIMELYQLGDQPDTFAKANSTGAAWSFKRISTALISHLQLMIVRAYGNVNRQDDRHLRAAIEFLEIVQPRDHNLTLDQRRLQQAMDLFAIALKDSRLGRLKTMRDKHVAHAALYTYGPDSPTYTDLFEFTRVTVDIWEHLAFGAGIASVPLADNIEDALASARTYWELMTSRITLPHNRASLTNSGP